VTPESWTLLVSWYAFGWVATALWCRKSSELTLSALVSLFICGPAAVCMLCPWPKFDPVIWRRKP
jgi:hypothetical protein